MATTKTKDRRAAALEAYNRFMQAKTKPKVDKKAKKDKLDISPALKVSYFFPPGSEVSDGS